MKPYGENPMFMSQNPPALEGREGVGKGYDHVFGNIRLKVKCA